MKWETLESIYLGLNPSVTLVILFAFYKTGFGAWYFFISWVVILILLSIVYNKIEKSDFIK